MRVPAHELQGPAILALRDARLCLYPKDDIIFRVTGHQEVDL
jgi:hypothetical protein